MLSPGVLSTEKAKIGTVGILYVPICEVTLPHAYTSVHVLLLFIQIKSQKGTLLF